MAATHSKLRPVTHPAHPPISQRRLCFVLGKGGAGKSTVSAALGLAGAAEGKRTLVIEVAAQHQVSRFFHAPSPHHRHRDREVELAPGLWGISIDPQHATEEYLAGQLKVRPVVEMLTRSRAFGHFTAAAPGLAELVTLGKIWSLAVALRPADGVPVWDRLIVDCPATGHGIALLETAQNVEELAGGGPIRDQAHRIQEVVAHPAATGILLVARPDELSVTEAVEATATLRGHALPVAAAVLNGVREPRFADDEAPALQELTTPGHPEAVVTAARAALRHLDHQRRDAGFVERLRTETGLPLVQVPHLVRRHLGVAELTVLAGHLREDA